MTPTQAIPSFRIDPAHPAGPPIARGENRPFDVVIIDDELEIVNLLIDIIQNPLLHATGATSAEEGMDLIRRLRPALVLLDLIMPRVSGFEMIEQILAVDPGIDVVMVTGHYSPEAAVDAIRKGAYDYITKPFDINRLRQRIDTWLADAKLRHRTHGADQNLIQTFELEGMIGRSWAMVEVFSKIRRVAPHFQTVLVTGETGTGKELVAKALHNLSPCATGPFVVCNSAAISEQLFESELFGHVRGAFTGATQDRVGFAKSANGGTLFLDEIGEIPLHLQAKLLRLLQNREIQRVGTSFPERVDVRVVAATNQDLRRLVAENKLREDLYYRLAMLEIKVPRLADRKEDLPILQRHFLNTHAARSRKGHVNLTRRAQAAFDRYGWPGNIRELENVIAASCMMTDDDLIDITDLPEHMRQCGKAGPDTIQTLMTLEELELKHAHSVLQEVSGNRARAAEILGISRATLYRLIARIERQSQPISPD